MGIHHVDTLLQLLVSWPLMVILSFLSISPTCTQAFVHPILHDDVIRIRGCDYPSSSSRYSKHRIPPLHIHPSEESSNLFEQPSLSIRTRDHATDASNNTGNTTSSTDGTIWNNDALYLERYKRRKHSRFETMARQYQEKRKPPPNPGMEPLQVVQELLDGLRRRTSSSSHDHPYWGVQILWESSTSTWQTILGRSIGIPNVQTFLLDNDNDDKHNHNHPLSNAELPQQKQIQKQSIIVQSLHRALSRPHQQFAILFLPADNDNENNDNDIHNYWVEFPTDVLEWEDNQECWIECRLRSTNNDQLLAVLGWTLQKKDYHHHNHDDDDDDDDGGSSSSSCWYLQALDWQDFRDEYRPGIGREEWERICG
jgi:hypothetical protein